MLSHPFTTENPFVATFCLSPEREAGQDKNASKTRGSYYLTDHLGSTRAVVDDNGQVLETFDYYPFGLLMPKRNTAGSNTIEKFTGKERDEAIGLDYFGARYYDAALGRWHNVDPLASERPSLTPYNYVRNNSLVFIDPDGLLDDYAFDEETGELTLVRRTSDDEDRIVKTDKNGNVKRKGEGFLGFLVGKKNRGKAKVDIDNIEKGILKDGMNFKTDDNIIGVGGEGQASVGGVEDFLVKLSDHINTEISAAYLSGENNGSTSSVYIDEYVGNDSQTSTISIRGNLVNINNVHTLVHTHLSRFDRRSKLTPSGDDREFKRDQLNIDPALKFFILTNLGRREF